MHVLCAPAPLHGAPQIMWASRCLSVDPPGADLGARLGPRKCTGEPHQLFGFFPASGGAYRIRAKHSRMCLDVQGPRADIEAWILQWSCNDESASQTFKPYHYMSDSLSRHHAQGNLQL